ncbi:hypothetical protein HGRIS_002617 [Hohenbuehelia grisea]|uniref:Gelsolin n=1 Tax=Hohenbuehelia grisea TaxID=104357 RepID=A0ABR3JN38_9AGAR
MDRPSPSRRSFQVPKPEAGLAEWTSKIKALQRQVDADEEDEQRRLEEEIAASRMARLRRSQGIGYTSNSDALDTFKSKDLAEVIRQEKSPAAEEPGHDRSRGQADALSKLTGAGSVVRPVSEVSSGAIPPSTSRPHVSQSQSKPEPISLAQFMGGRASGPRLNKHTPQQDAHDPKQFEQQTRIDAPHPIFGRGGVAMPGLTSRSKSSADSQNGQATSPTNGASPIPNTRSGTIPTVIAPTEPDNVRPPSPRKQEIRERTVSTPMSSAVGSAKPIRSRASLGEGAAHSSIPPSSSSSSQSPVSSPSSGTSPTFPRSITPKQQHHFTGAVPTPNRTTSPMQAPHYTGLSKAPVNVPSLARPVLPAPKPLKELPIIGASKAPSPAFLKAPTQKEPTPSLSRLQGRGFVQSMVQVSSQLASSSPPHSPPPDKPRAAKRVSVLDRWQPASSKTPSPPPQTSPKAIPMRKSRTLDPAQRSPEPAHSGKPIVAPKPSRSVSTSPSAMRLNETPSPTQDKQIPGGHPVMTGPGLGSATTMVVFKTSPTEETSFSTVDEMGFRADRHVGHSNSESPVMAGKPLVHPTRDRVKVPRKGKPARSATAPPEALERSSSIPAPLPGKLATRQEPVIIRPAATQPAATPVAEVGSGRAVKDMVGARALPGLVVTDIRPPPSQAIAPAKPSSKSPISKADEQRPPRSPTDYVQSPSHTAEASSPGSAIPVKHARIPSTGNRATVMDVHQAFSEQDQPPPPPSSAPESPPSPIALPSQPIPRPRNIIPPSMQAEKRKSSYERYSAIILPPLPEEATPTPTPHGTLSRNAKGIVLDDDATLDSVKASGSAIEPIANNDIVRVHAEPIEFPLRKVNNISAFLNAYSSTGSRTDADRQTISVEVMAIVGSSASPITHGSAIFYDSEVLAIIYRFKTKSTGLVSSKVWSWQGKHSQIGDREDRKLQDLAKRYGTSIIPTRQLSEPPELVSLLGGQLAIRQGNRTHWSSENTAMHLIRSYRGVIYIDEFDLGITTLCSGFSYCVSVLDSVYVWHGRGSTSEERIAALNYARSICSNPASIQELIEGETDDDEMFWMILGTDEYANADHWRWRRSANVRDPKIWRVDAQQGENPVVRIDSLSEERSLQDSVYVVDCIWELFVLVGRSARGARESIGLAVSFAMDLSAYCASSRPFLQPVHILILPSQVPCDLRMSLRDMEELWLNEGDVPDHMNLLSYENALKHLQTDAWDARTLRDHTMLPLGVDSSGIP